jgi:hypothetical protein
MENRKYVFALSTALVLLIVSLPASLHAQAITGRVVGTVTDPSEAVIAGANVTITSAQTNQTRTTSTNEVGNYEFAFLPIGTYRLVVEAQGFQKSEVTNFTLNVDQVLRLNMVLTVGEVTETISVEAGALNLQTEDATVGTVIDSQKVVELPLNGRSFVQLALLTPGVNPGTPGSITVRRLRGSVGQAVGMSANGARDTQNRFYYDGIEAMDLDSYSFSFSPSIDAIEQFKVQSSTYSSDVGGAPGGQVNLMTKAGTNDYHGGVWWFNRNDAFSAVSAFTPWSPNAKPARLNRNQYGANLGGPIRKEKAFFFFNWESGRLIAGQGQQNLFIPPTAFRTGDFSSFSGKIFDPATGQPFANNQIPAARIKNYASTFLRDYVPAPNANEAAVNFRPPAASAPIDQDQYIGRIDYRFTDKNSMYGSYMYNEQSDDTVPNFVWDTRGNTGRAQNFSLADVHLFSSAFINEARIGWHRFFEHEFFGTTDNPELDIANKIGIPGVSTDPRNFGAPGFSAGYTLPTVRGIGPRDRLNQLWQVSDNVTWIRGSHSFKFGGLFARRNWTFDESVNPRGSFNFDGRTTSGGAPSVREYQFAAFLLGLATGAEVSVEPFATRMNNFWQAYYFQDDWKVTPNLTLNWGMRYEYFTAPSQRGTSVNFGLNGAVPGFTPSAQWFKGFPDIADTQGVPTNLVNSDKNDFGPRLGFAYKMPWSQDFVVRGGYGVYYTPEITNTWTTLTLNPPIVKTFSFTGTFNNPINVETAFQGAGQARAGLFGAGAFDPNQHTSYTQQWNLTLQKKLAFDTLVDIGYVGSKGTGLTMTFDGNRPLVPIVPAGAPSLASRRPFQGFDRIGVTKAIGHSIYHSLQLKVERRVARGLSFLGAYTWSKALGNADISSVGGGTFLGGLQDFFNLSAEKAPATFDIAHRLSVSMIYDLPFFRDSSSAVARALLGGWQVGTITTLQTGFASTLSGVGDITVTGISSRPDVVAGQQSQLSRGDRSRDRWFNTAAFTRPPDGRFGNASRMPIYLPGLAQVDFSANKDFRFSETNALQFRAEFFNLFNHVNLGAPGLAITAPNTFGVIRTSIQGAAGMPGDARIIQFALKYRF